MVHSLRHLQSQSDLVGSENIITAPSKDAWDAWGDVCSCCWEAKEVYAQGAIEQVLVTCAGSAYSSKDTNLFLVQQPVLSFLSVTWWAHR